jgi:hypothetical protein
MLGGLLLPPQAVFGVAFLGEMVRNVANDENQQNSEETPSNGQIIAFE